jgi:hypothetical protein
MTNQLIWEPQPDSARGTCFAIVESMQKTGKRARYHVKYEDLYRRVEGRWVFQKRVSSTQRTARLPWREWDSPRC